MSIEDFITKSKPLKERLYLPAIVVLVGSITFGLGRISAMNTRKIPITLQNPVVNENQAAALASVESDDTGETFKNDGAPSSARNVSLPAPTLSDPGGEVVASKNGKKFYLPWCSGAKRISPANKITFSSKEAAIKAGYSPAANCKGI